MYFLIQLISLWGLRKIKIPETCVPILTALFTGTGKACIGGVGIVDISVHREISTFLELMEKCRIGAV